MALRCYKDVLPFTAMVAVECTNVGLNTLFKAATLKGMSYYVFIVYSYAFATLILLPWLFIFRSTTVLPSIKFPLIFRICLLALIGFLAQICGYKGIDYSSPTLASAISNLTPAFTFILAIIFRKFAASRAFMPLSFFFAIFTGMERLALRSSSTRSKIIGTIASMSGALLVVLYKGPTISSTPFPTPSISLQWPLHSSQSDWIKGGLLFAAEYLLLSFWYIIQMQIMEIYPSELVVAFFYNLCLTIISAPVCSTAERNLSAWRLRPGIALVAIVYTAFFGSIFSTIVHAWGLRMKGPVYIAMFKPLSIAIAAALGIIFLGDALHLGSVVGAIIISIGFYAVIWGKAKEEKYEDRGFSSMGASSSHKISLLQSHKVEEM